MADTVYYEEPKWKIWFWAALIAALFHLLLLFYHFSWAPPIVPPPVEIQQIDPRKLEAIRNQWKNQKQILLDKDKSKPSEKEAPKDSRYMSDRNIHVDKEQRAKETAVVPRPKIVPKTAQKAQPELRSKPLPDLGALGVPLKLTPKPPRPRVAEQEETRPAQEGGDQYIDEKQLPEGSENLLNSQESVFYSFYARLYESIGPLWESQIHESLYRRQIQEGDYSTQVDVICNEEGELIAVHQLHGSGIPEFDAAVQTAWKKLGRFPNPPRGLLNQVGEVHMGWTFTVRVGQGMFQVAPPERNY